MGIHKKIIAEQFLLFRLLLITTSFSLFNAAVGQTSFGKPVFDFKGRYIVAVSDADMVPFAYLDGHLGAVEGKDALSVILLDKPVNSLKATAIEVSNSVTGPPSSVAVSPHGKYAIVIESRGQRPTNKPEPLLSDLPTGKIITVVDLSDLDHPKVAQPLDGPERPLSVTFNTDGSLVAITYRPENTSRNPLAF